MSPKYQYLYIGRPQLKRVEGLHHVSDIDLKGLTRVFFHTVCTINNLDIMRHIGEGDVCVL